MYERKSKARVKKTTTVVLGRENMFDCHPEEDAEAEDNASPPAAPAHSKKRKTTSKKAKAQNVQPPPPEPVTMKEMPAPEWIALRRVNPYRQDRDHVADSKFWTLFQQRNYEEIFSQFVNKCVIQKSINIAHFDKTPTNSAYFEGIQNMCVKLNLLPLMRFQHDVSPPLVAQFYAIVHFGIDMQRTLTWMSGDEKCSAPFSVLAGLLGYEYTDIMVDRGYKIHDKGVFQAIHLADLYPPLGKVGSVGDLLPFYDIMHRIFREILSVKVGDKNKIRGHLINLLHYTCHNSEQGPIDVMDFMWHEMYSVVMNRKVPIYAPYITALIAEIAPDALAGRRLTGHSSVNLLVKKGKATAHEGEDEEEEELHAGNPHHFELRPRSHTFHHGEPSDSGSKKSNKIWRLLKNMFCLQQDMHKKQWEEHKSRKESMKALKDGMRASGMDIAHGSESHVTPFEKYQSKFARFDVEAGDEASSHRPHGSMSSGESSDDPSTSHS